MPATLTSLTAAVSADPGLRAETSAAQINLGLAAANSLNAVLLQMIASTHVNDDGLITEADMQTISTAVFNNPAAWQAFILGHGNDNGNVVSGFHYVQNDGGNMVFQGRDFIDTVADAIYHYGFDIKNGRYFNEDGNDNELTADVAGWLNYFLNGVNVVHGSGLNDELGTGAYSNYFAAARNETFLAGAGNDKVWSGEGHDRVMCGTGNDTVGAGIGNDRLYGESGNDTLWGESGNDQLFGGLGNDNQGAGDGNDLLEGNEGNDTLWGEDGRDFLSGGDGNDLAGGGQGNDSLYGDAGNDRLNGDTGNDWLGGGTGNDTMSGGDGYDVLKGGTGADAFVLWENVQVRDRLYFGAGDSGKTWATMDYVEGFRSGIDEINLTAFGPMTFEELDFKGGGAESCYYDGRFVRIDANGDGATDMMIHLRNVQTLTADDFVFA